MVKKTFFFLFLLLSHATLFSRSGYILQSRHQIDSLKKLLSGASAQKQADVLNELASCYAADDFDSSILYSSHAARMTTNNGYQKGIGIARYQTGNAYYYKLDFKNALTAYLSAQPVLENGGFYKELGDISLMIGNINHFIRRGDKAIASYREAITYYQAASDIESLAKVWDVLSLAFYWLTDSPTDSSLVYGFKLLGYAREHNDLYREPYALMNISMFYMVSESMEQKRTGLLYADSAMAKAQMINEDVLISIINGNRGNYYDFMTSFAKITGDASLARYHYQNAYKASVNAGCNWLQAVWLNRLAMVDLGEKRYRSAGINLDMSENCLNDFYEKEWKSMSGEGFVLSPLGKISDYFMAQRERYVLYRTWHRLAKETNNYKHEAEYLQLLYEAKDSMFATQQGKQLELLMAENEADKQQQRIRNLARDNELNRLQLSRSWFIFIGAGAGILMVSAIILLVMQRRRLRAEQRSVSMEQRLLRAQMNPHFIFNSLASIQNFVINENSDHASIYLSRFSQLVRNILDNSTEEYVTLEKEINTIENYLELQQVRYAGKFDYRIELDPLIDPENTMIPPMLAQPFIENAIEHGIRHKKTQGHIDIRFRLQDGLLRFEVEDDGVGRLRAQEIESKQSSRHRSMATSITRDRLNNFNRKQKKKIRMVIIDLRDDSGQGTGTRVEFGVPVVVR